MSMYAPCTHPPPPDGEKSFTLMKIGSTHNKYNKIEVQIAFLKPDYDYFSASKQCISLVELAWCSGSVMDCHATTRGSIPGGNGVFTKLHVLRMGQ